MKSVFHATDPTKGWVDVQLTDGEHMWVMLESPYGVRQHDLVTVEECCLHLLAQQNVLRRTPLGESVRLCPRILQIKPGPPQTKIDFSSEILYPVEQGKTIPQTPEELLTFFTRRLPKDLCILGQWVDMKFRICMVFGGEAELTKMVNDPLRYWIYSPSRDYSEV